MKQRITGKKVSNQCGSPSKRKGLSVIGQNVRAAKLIAPPMVNRKKNVAQGFLVAGGSLALLFGIAFLKGRADEPDNIEYQEGEE